MTEENLNMAKRKIKLTDDQRNKNAEILARLESERKRLIEETRALQQQERRKPGRKRRKKEELITDDEEEEEDDDEDVFEE